MADLLRSMTKGATAVNPSRPGEYQKRCAGGAQTFLRHHTVEHHDHRRQQLVELRSISSPPSVDSNPELCHEIITLVGKLLGQCVLTRSFFKRRFNPPNHGCEFGATVTCDPLLDHEYHDIILRNCEPFDVTLRCGNDPFFEGGLGFVESVWKPGLMFMFAVLDLTLEFLALLGPRCVAGAVARLKLSSAPAPLPNHHHHDPGDPHPHATFWRTPGAGMSCRLSSADFSLRGSPKRWSSDGSAGTRQMPRWQMRLPVESCQLHGLLLLGATGQQRVRLCRAPSPPPHHHGRASPSAATHRLPSHCRRGKQQQRQRRATPQISSSGSGSGGSSGGSCARWLCQHEQRKRRRQRLHLPPPLLLWPLLLLLLCSQCLAALPPSVLESPPLSMPRAICRGQEHACAILSPAPSSSLHHHRLLCWGQGRNGALGRGNGSATDLGDDEFPSAGGYVDLGRGVQPLAVACGQRTTCVLVTATTNAMSGLGCKALCFGRVNFRSFVDYETVGIASAPSASAVTLSAANSSSDAATATAAVSAGRTHVCILSNDMRLACAGPGSPEAVLPSDLPSRGYLRLGAAAADVACGGHYTCVVTAALRLRCFGRSDDEHPSAAGAVVVGAPLLSLGLGDQHTCVVTTGLRPRCFGLAKDGQLGLGRVPEPNKGGRVVVGDDELPSVYGAVEAGAAIIAVAGGWRHSCAVTAGLQLRCWGWAPAGSLGYGRGYDYIGRDSPASEGGRVPLGTDGSSPRLQLPGTGVRRKAVGVSSYHESTCVLTAAREVLCWGGRYGLWLGYPGLRAACPAATPADHGAVQLGVGGGDEGSAAADPSVIRILWCDSHFGNASTLRSTASQQQQLASCALGFPFTFGVIGTPPPPHAPPLVLSLRRSASDAGDTQCVVQPATAAARVTECSSGSGGGGGSLSGSGVHGHSGTHYMASPAVRLPLPRPVYTVIQATVPPVTTLALDRSRTPFSTAHGLTNRRRLLFLLGSSRPTGAHYVITTTAGATATAREESRIRQFTTNSTRLWLTLTSEGAHNLTVYTVDAGGVEDPSPLTLNWLADFTPPSTSIVSGPPQPVAATATAHFKFGCSDSSSSRRQQQHQQHTTCSYRVALRQLSGGGEGITTASSSVSASLGGGTGYSSKPTLSVAPVTMLHAVAAIGAAAPQQGVSASPHLSFRLSAGREAAGVGATTEYRIIHGAIGNNAPTVQHRHPWHTIAAADGSGTALTLHNLPDGTYMLQLRSGGGQGSYAANSAVVAFSVDTTAPRTRVQNVTRRVASDGSGTAHWCVRVIDIDRGGSGVAGSSAVAALWWATAGTTDADAPSPLPRPATAQWRRVNVSAAAAADDAAALSLSTPLWATVLRVKLEDAAGNVDPFPRTISWGHALSLRSAPSATTFQTSATFSLITAIPAPASFPNSAARPPLPTVRWRLDGAAWRSAVAATGGISASIFLPSFAPGPHVWEAQPVAGDGSPDAVQSTPVSHTWQVLSSASLDGSGLSFTDLSDGPHEMGARAVDAAGNVDRGNATYRWRIDTTSPSCSAAWEWRVAGGGSSVATARVSVNGSEALTLVQLGLGNALSASAEDWSTTTLTPSRQNVVTASPAVTYDGLHTLRVKATDAVGNVAAMPCAVLQWLVDTTPPTISLMPPLGVDGMAAAVMNRRVWNVTVSAQDRLSPVVSISYAVLWQQGEDQRWRTDASVQWKAVPLFSQTEQDGLEKSLIAAAAPVTLSVTVPGDGRYSLWLRAVDAEGNVAVAPSAFNWTVDTTPPIVTLHAADSGATLPSLIAHHWLLVCLHLDEPLASLRWAVSEYLPSQQQQQRHEWVTQSVRRGASQHCMNVTAASGTTDGQYALALKAADAAGNIWHNSTAHVWRVDTVAPTSCTVFTPSAAVNSSRVAVSFGPFGGPQGIVGHWYALVVAADTPWVWRPTGGAKSTVVQLPASGAHQGPVIVQYVLKVKATDAAGNVGSRPCASLSVTFDTASPVTAVHSPSIGAALLTSSPRITLLHNEPVTRVRWWWQQVGGGAGVRHVVSATPPSNITYIAASEDSSTDGLKTILIQAEDRAGNMEAVPVRFSWVKDTIAPSVGIAGSALATFSERRLASTRLDLAVVVRDRNHLLRGQQGRAGVWYSSHALTATPAAAPSPLQWTPVPFLATPTSATMHRLPITVAVSDDGWYRLALKAVDAAGNTAVNDSALRWAVDTTPPTADIASAPLNTTLGRATEARFSFRCTSVTACKPWGAHQLCTPVADCASYRYRVVATAAVGGNSGCSGAVVVPWTTSSSRHVSLRRGLLRTGSLRLEVKAVDAAGLLQLRTSAHTWAVFPSQEVVISVVTRPPTLSAWDMAPFTFRASMGGAPYPGQRFQLRVDTETGMWQALPRCLANQSTCSYVLRGIARGSHVVHARAVDPGSGMPSASVSVRWTLGVCNATAYAQISPSDGALRCIRCPAGANCTSDDVTLSKIGAQIGWWAAAGRGPAVQFYRCPLPGSCEGGGNTTEASACAPSFDRSSIMCGGCAAGYVRRKQTCTACPEAAVGVSLAVLCTLLLVAFICFSVSSSSIAEASHSQGHHRESASVVQRILISFLSTLTTIGDFRARGPRLVQDFIGLTSTVSGGVSVRFAPIRCTLGLGFFVELLATLGMPLFLLCCCAVVVTTRSRLQRHFRARETMLGCAVFTVFLVYPTLTRATLQVFRCTDVEVDGSRYLLHDLTARCFRGTHSAAVLVSALATTVVGLGVPATIITLVAKSKTGGARLQLKRTYEFIFDGYLADRLLWWEALVLLRKFALQCVEVFIADATIQASVASWIIVAAVALHLWWRPYNSALLNRVDAIALSVSYVTQALSSTYPVLLLSGGGGGTGLAEAMVTVVLLGLNVGVILLLVVLALQTSLVLHKRRRASAPSSHPASTMTPRLGVAGCSSVAVAKGGTATVSVIPSPAVASFGAGLEDTATATTVTPTPTEASYRPASAAVVVAPPLPSRAISSRPPPRGGRRRQHSHVSSRRSRVNRHSRRGRRRTTTVARSGRVGSKSAAAETL